MRGNLKSKAPAEGIVVLPVGKKRPKVRFICFGLITKKLWAQPCDFRYAENKSMEGRQAAARDRHCPKEQ